MKNGPANRGEGLAGVTAALNLPAIGEGMLAIFVTSPGWPPRRASRRDRRRRPWQPPPFPLPALRSLPRYIGQESDLALPEPILARQTLPDSRWSSTRTPLDRRFVGSDRPDLGWCHRHWPRPVLRRRTLSSEKPFPTPQRCRPVHFCHNRRSPGK